MFNLFWFFLSSEFQRKLIFEKTSRKIDTLKYYVLTLEKQLDPIKSDQLTDDDQLGARLYSIRISFSSSNSNELYRDEKKLRFLALI